MPRFPENEIAVLDGVFSPQLATALPEVTNALLVHHVPSFEDVQGFDRPGMEVDQAKQEHAFNVDQARQQVRAALERIADLDPLRTVNDDIQIHEFDRALGTLASLPPPMSGESKLDLDTVERAFETAALPYIGIRVRVNTHAHPPVDIEEPVKKTLPGYSGPHPSDSDKRDLHSAFALLVDGPSRAFRIGLLIAECMRGKDDLAVASAQLGQLLASMPAERGTERRFLALRVASLQLELADRAYRQVGIPDPTQRDEISRMYVLAAELVGRSDIAIDPENPMRRAIELAATLGQDKLRAGLNFLGFQASYVPVVSADMLERLARQRIDAAKTAASLFETFKLKAEQLVELASQVEFDRNLARITQAIDNDKVDISLLQQAITGKQVEGVQAQISSHDWGFTLGLGMALVGAVAVTVASGGTAAAAAAAVAGAAPGAVSSVVGYLGQRDGLQIQEEIAKLQHQVATKNTAIANLERSLTQMQIEFLGEKIARIKARELSADLYYASSQIFRDLAQRHLDLAVRWAFLFERAVAFVRLRPDLEGVKLDYAERFGLLAAPDKLLEAVQTIAEANIPDTRFEHLPERYSLRTLYPIEFARFQRTGHMQFAMSLPWLDKARPGSHRMRIKYVAARVVGSVPGEGYIGKLVHTGTFLVRDPATTPEPGAGRLMPTPAQLQEALAQLASGGRVDAIAGVLPYCLPPSVWDFSDASPLPTEHNPDPLPAGAQIPLEGYGPAGRWELEIKDRNNQPLLSVADVTLHVSYIFPERDLDLERRVRGLVAEYEQELLEGRKLDEIASLSLSIKRPDVLAKLASTGHADLEIHAGDFRAGALLKSIVVQATDRNPPPRSIPGLEIVITRSNTALELMRTTGNDGFTEPDNVEIPVLPESQRFDLVGTYQITVLHPERLIPGSDLTLFFLYELTAQP